MDWPRASLGYRVGILNFLRFAFVDSADDVKKPCPCRKCINSSNHDRPTMHKHLTIYGMLQDYRIWDFHGEKPMVQSHDNMCSVLHASSRENNDEDNHNPVVQEMLCDAFGMHEEPFTNNENNIGTSTSHLPNESCVEDFYRLVEEGKQPLYTGCTEFSKLTFLVELFQLKVSGKWSDKSFTALLNFLRRALPSEAQVDRMNEQIDDLDLRALSHGPNSVAFSYHGFNINGVAFRTVESEQNKKVQNSGVMLQSMHDNDDHETTYYGRLTDVISLDYGGRGRIVLFRCDWVNTTSGVKIDPLGFIMVNFSRLIHTGEREEHEPFILASQAQMVYYVRDPKEEDWCCDINGVDIELTRTDVEGTIVDGQNEIMPSTQSQQKKCGKTVMKDVHALQIGDRLIVKFNERGQPYGEMQPTLANFVGTIARNGNVLPLSFLDWRKMTKSCLDDAWRQVTARFDIPDQHRARVMQMMGGSWRRWKAEIKATSYDPNIPLNELMCIRPIPHNLTSSVWETLCRYWKSNEENGRKPTRIEIFHLSRQSKKKGGALVDDEAIRVEDELNKVVQRHLQDKPEGTQTTEVHEDAFRQVFPEQCNRRTIFRHDNLPTSEVTDKLREMEEKMKVMEAQRKAEMEQMRQMHEHQIQNFTNVIQSMISGTAGGSRGPELLPTQMDWPRASLGYRVGILNFLRFAFVDSTDEVKKPCACRKCINSSNHECPTMHEHLTIYGMLQDYHIWDFHGEKPMVQSRDSMCSVLHASSRENNDEDNHNLVVQEMTSKADEADATIPTAPMKLNTDNSLHQPCLHATTCKTSLKRSMSLLCRDRRRRGGDHEIGEGIGKELRSVGKQTGVREEIAVGCRAWAASKAGGYLVLEQEGQVEDQAVGDEL
ncbi:hypothetical protein ZIOFF_053021 [Zingiber officinale]|uniref:Transposase-associated domain-containing protein n=1 Tax=Zingiber officinale TaxID=94328 RepID=A0A8J5KI72_ZINOF|nr:hypothetical protein ZIOFF_053021 [Zingiber officinale]